MSLETPVEKKAPFSIVSVGGLGLTLIGPAPRHSLWQGRDIGFSLARAGRLSAKTTQAREKGLGRADHTE